MVIQQVRMTQLHQQMAKMLLELLVPFKKVKQVLNLATWIIPHVVKYVGLVEVQFCHDRGCVLVSQSSAPS